VPQAWRDPFIATMPDGGQYALLCAKRGSGPLAARACVALARLDAPDRWTTLPPLNTPPFFPTMEVPEVFPMAGRWWLTFNAHGGWGRRLDTPSRQDSGGTYYLVADDPFGEWRVPEECLLVGSGKGRRDAVVARSVPFGGERLVYHHYTGSGEADSPRALGLPKKLDVVGDRLVLRPWQGLDAIRQPVEIGGWQAASRGPFSSGDWTVDGEFQVGHCAHGAATCVAPMETGDAEVCCEVRLQGAERAGIGLSGANEGQGAAAVLLDVRRREVALSEIRAGTFGPVLDPPLDAARRAVSADGLHHLRVLGRGRYVEAFVNDELVFSTVWPRDRAGRNLVLVVEGGRAAFRIGKVHALAAMT
jgi:hypothetical protein